MRYPRTTGQKDAMGMNEWSMTTQNRGSSGTSGKKNQTQRGVYRVMPFLWSGSLGGGSRGSWRETWEGLLGAGDVLFFGLGAVYTRAFTWWKTFQPYAHDLCPFLYLRRSSIKRLKETNKQKNLSYAFKSVWTRSYHLKVLRSRQAEPQLQVAKFWL